jgi:hypothetical protein
MSNGRTTWGPKMWSLIHSFSVNENLKISNDIKHNYYIFYTSLMYIIPCIECKYHYGEIIYGSNKLEESLITRNYLKKWCFNTHNIINKLLKKDLFLYKNFLKDYRNVNNEDIFYIIYNVYKDLDYENMSIFNYNQIFNFFINFCLLYPNKVIKKKIKKLINKKKIIEINTPNEFKRWFDKNIKLLKNIILNTNTNTNTNTDNK